MRTIIRFSLNDDRGSRLRNILNPILENAGMQRVSTGSYNGDLTEADLRGMLARFWNAMANFRSRAHLDHFWMYTDQL